MLHPVFQLNLQIVHMTIYECLRRYCYEKKLLLPTQRQRSYIGIETLKIWIAGKYDEKIQYNWSEEPTGRFHVTCAPPFFVPTNVDVIEQISICPSQGKANFSNLSFIQPLHKGYITPYVDLYKSPYTLRHPMNNRYLRVYGPLCNYLHTLALPSIQDYITLTVGSIECSARVRLGYTEGLYTLTQGNVKSKQTLTRPYESNIEEYGKK